jgi:hypothetical protein
LAPSFADPSILSSISALEFDLGAVRAAATDAALNVQAYFGRTDCHSAGK